MTWTQISALETIYHDSGSLWFFQSLLPNAVFYLISVYETFPPYPFRIDNISLFSLQYEMWRPTDLKAPTLSRDNQLTGGGEAVSLTRPPPFTPRRFLVLISVTGWVDWVSKMAAFLSPSPYLTYVARQSLRWDLTSSRGHLDCCPSLLIQYIVSYRRADNSRPVSFTVSTWDWVYATNLSRLQSVTR
jgi:hypothetical protein